MSDDSSIASKTWFDRIKLFSGEPKNRQDIKEILRDAYDRSLIDGEALSIIEGALQVSEMQVRDIMIPRSQMVAIKVDQQLEDFLPSIVESAHSRFPVLGDNNDEVQGILLAKDLLPLLMDDSQKDRFQIKNVLRPATFVPESKRLNVLLKEFRANRNHMAIVVDEYGGIAGLVTIEDVLEQIVGEIEDEHDVDEEDNFIKSIEDHVHMVKALTPIEDFNEFFGTQFSNQDFDTIGGILVHHFGRLPEPDEETVLGPFNFKVVNANNRRINLVEVTPVEA